MPDHKVYIVGVGPGGVASLLPEARQAVQMADTVIGGERLLDMFPDLSGERVIIRNNLEEVADFIRSNLQHKKMVVLASGDPNFYGIARYLTSKLGKAIFEIVPNISAMQLAFARIKESWDDAVMVSVHSRPIEDIVGIAHSSHKIGLFTDDKNSPGDISRVFQERGVENCRAYICQDLGSEKEKIIATDLYSLRGMEFSPLNVMILVKDKLPDNTRFGIPDNEFHRQREGLITKLEVRAISLAKMRLREDSVVWDIGAGSGAVSIEAAFLAKKGSVFAIEKDARSVEGIRENVRRFGTGNVTVVQEQAPEGLDKLPDPAAVFVGGSGGHLPEILQAACRRLKPGGNIVVNAATLETLHTALESLKANGFATEVTSVNVARSKDFSNLTHFQAMNPVFVITGWQGKELAAA
ncbi:MAG: precorrin-6y C5,15-methyltransferase (decarboxylating) subunit CbiE [Chloroflexota bacterium]|nr:precorrin-6y C5,15-methyltransferase (decarboxylating) subunit CbiE [Chloroflexota bacterium]